MSYDWFLEKRERNELPDPLLNAWSLGKGVGDLPWLALEVRKAVNRSYRRSLVFMIGGVLGMFGSCFVVSNLSKPIPVASLDSLLAAVFIIMGLASVVLSIVGMVMGGAEDERGKIFQDIKKDWDALEEFLGQAVTLGGSKDQAKDLLVLFASVVLNYEQESVLGMESDRQSKAKNRFQQAHRIFDAFGLIRGGYKTYFDLARNGMEQKGQYAQKLVDSVQGYILGDYLDMGPTRGSQEEYASACDHLDSLLEEHRAMRVKLCKLAFPDEQIRMPLRTVKEILEQLK